MNTVETTKAELKEVIAMLNSTLSNGTANYASKNPDLIMFLMNNIQREKDRELQKVLEGVVVK